MSLAQGTIQKYTEQFKKPELFASINGQIASVPMEPENPLRAAEMPLEEAKRKSVQRKVLAKPDPQKPPLELSDL